MIRHRPAKMLAVVLVVVLAELVGACSAGEPAGGSSSYPAVATTTQAEDPALVAIRAAIGEINATAGGPVAAQRAVLDALATPDADADQQACPVATTTLAFDPAWRDLRPAPGATSGGGYLLPTYITIYSGDRIVGTDLANLRLWLIDGRARTSALCVS